VFAGVRRGEGFYAAAGAEAVDGVVDGDEIQDAV
jgi:hypothetical protein